MEWLRVQRNGAEEMERDGRSRPEWDVRDRAAEGGIVVARCAGCQRKCMRDLRQRSVSRGGLGRLKSASLCCGKVALHRSPTNAKQRLQAARR